MLGSIIIANYIPVTNDSESSIHRGKEVNLLSLFVKLHQKVQNKMPTLLSEEKLLMIATTLCRGVTAQHERQPEYQNSLVPAWSLG